MPALTSAEDTVRHLRARPPRHLLAGRLEGGDGGFAVFNPATGQAFMDCAEATRAQLDEAVAAARAAQPGWAAVPEAQRRASIGQLAAVLRANADELAAIVTLEQGKPLARARDEVLRAADQAEALARLPLGPTVLRDDAQGRVELRRRPLGVVGAITPWNMPIVLSVPKIAHALYTGNAVVLKPSPYTPLAALRLGELLQGVFAPGLLNVLAGGNDFGRWMAEHPGIAKISFTGSSATGKRVMASAASNLKRVTLELGGNDAAIVLGDVDVAAVAPRLFFGAFVNSGQVCMAIKRMYVHESVYEPLAAALAQLAAAARVGDGFDPATTMGPVQNRAQHEIVRGILDHTRGVPGARVLAGGDVLPRPGYFVAPTVVADIAEGTRLVDEEPFGPVLPLIRFSDEDDAVARANASPWGLGGSVWSRDARRAGELAARLDTGTAWVNRHVGVEPDVPFGGAKQSGLGREYGLAGLEAYMDVQSVFLPPLGA